MRTTMWTLERLAPARWGRKRHVEVDDRDYYTEWREGAIALEALHSELIDVLRLIWKKYPAVREHLEHEAVQDAKRSYREWIQRERETEQPPPPPTP